MQKIDHLIITSPYEEPKEHWWYDENKKSFDLAEGRRPAGYIIASQAYESADDPGKFIELPLVNRIRPRVKAWREGKNGGIPYAGATSITRRLLQHWHDQSERDLRFFFCQLDAMETLIWLAEAPAADKVGIDIPSDGGPFRRYCSKMATGSGKTIVMAMLIAWQALNKAANPQDARFSKNIFVVAPGLTVRDRLKVLIPSEPGNYYDKFNVVPPGLQDLLRQAKVVVRNRHILNWETDEKIAKKKGVDKRGARSDQAYVRDVLRDLANAKNILVINDEAHHAWRIPAESKIRGLKKEDIEEATKWVGGLDRIHVVRGILACYDFTATPFAPSGKTASEEALFPWIVSDFGLSDAIESGLVKTPRVVIRDDGMPDTRTYRSKLYHIYKWVKEDLNRKAQPHETLPDLIINGYYLLGKDWLETAERWKEDGFPTPPVMITVANRTETAARIKYALDRNKIDIKELCDPGRIIHRDSRILEKAESQEEAMQFKLKESSEGDEGKELSKKDSAEYLREIVNTIGVENKPGEAFQNVISVGMLTEGWDVKTVTHIMGLRAFSSQLLCEQVVGRGLRRTDYDIDEETGLLTPDYVNIFGVPFTFMPHETTDDRKTRAQVPKYVIEPRPEKQQYELQWPRIARIEYEMKPTLSLDMRKVRPLELVLRETITRADMAKILGGNVDTSETTPIDLTTIADQFRMQKIIFNTAIEVFDRMNPKWPGSKEQLLSQIIAIIEEFLESERIRIIPEVGYDDVRRLITMVLNMSKIVEHIWNAIEPNNAESTKLVFEDDHRPIGATGDMIPWHTGKPRVEAKRCHINFCVCDSSWESAAAFELDRNPKVASWVKNDHLGFGVHYIFQGERHRYRPDFIILLTNGIHLVLEIKGLDTEQARVKRGFLEDWVKAVNYDGRFGKWTSDVSFDPADIPGAIGKAYNYKG